MYAKLLANLGDGARLVVWRWTARGVPPWTRSRPRKSSTPGTVSLDRSHYERRDAMPFEMAEAGDRGARDAILRVIQRDPLPAKRGALAVSTRGFSRLRGRGAGSAVARNARVRDPSLATRRNPANVGVRA